MSGIPADFKVRVGFYSGPVPKIARKMVVFLEKLPFKELIDARQLARAIGIKYRTIKDYTVEPHVQANKYSLYSNSSLWGSKRTIKELRRRNNAD